MNEMYDDDDIQRLYNENDHVFLCGKGGQSLLLKNFIQKLY